MNPRETNKASLRARAEEQLAQNESIAPQPKQPVNTQRLVHELQVHQLELEMQNEELREARARIEESLERVSDLYDLAPMSYFTLDSESKIVQLNLTAARLLGKERALLVGMRFLNYLDSASRIEFRAVLEHLFFNRTKEHVCVEATLAKPKLRHLQIDLNLAEDYQSCRMTVTDVSELKQSEESLRETNELNMAMIDSLPFPMHIINAKGHILYMSQKMVEEVGRRAEGEVCWNVLDPKQMQDKNCPLRQPIQFGVTTITESTGIYCPMMDEGANQGESESGRFFEVHHTGMLYNGEPALLEIFIDLTERKQAEKSQAQADAVIWRQANYDKLTGLPNRYLFYDRLEHALLNTKREKGSLTLMFLDIDNFKMINDTLGHHLGDELLAETARRITGLIRETDTVARLSGDEFTVILPGLADTARIEAIAEAIREEMDRPFDFGINQIHTTVSIGITRYPADGTDVETLMKNADQAMYSAKWAGRNQYSYFTPEMAQAAKKGQLLADDLRKALERREFYVCYQPIVELASQHWIGAEALLRWRHPKRGVIMPDEFIPMAEQMGAISDIGYWVLSEASNQVKRWLSLGAECAHVSINKSPREFSRDKNFHRWLDFIEKCGVPTECFNVEITENLLASDYPGMSQKLHAYKEAGMLISLDDFGTGYSSLAYLRRFNIDVLKIDRSFVMDMETNPDSRAIIKAIIGLAHGIGVKTTAEGVETEGQREMLTDYGCDYAQGYLFARPIEADEYFDALEKRQPKLQPSAELTV